MEVVRHVDQEAILQCLEWLASQLPAQQDGTGPEADSQPTMAQLAEQNAQMAKTIQELQAQQACALAAQSNGCVLVCAGKQQSRHVRATCRPAFSSVLISCRRGHQPLVFLLHKPPAPQGLRLQALHDL